MNTVIYSGRIVKELEVLTNDKGEYAFITVANNEDKKKPVFVRGVISGKTLDFVRTWIKSKGRVIITGALSEYKKEGEQYGRLQVNIIKVEPIDWKEKEEREEPANVPF